MYAIVLQRQDFREYDQIISLFTEEKGKISLIAKGIKKIVSKNSGNLFVGNIIDIDFAQGKEYNILTKINNVQFNKLSISRVDKALTLKYVLNLTQRNTDQEDQNVQLFHLLLSIINYIENTSNKCCHSLIYSYIFKMLKLIGFEINLECCVNCNKKENDNINISYGSGGLICSSCFDTIYANSVTQGITKEELEILKLLINREWNEVNSIKISQKIKKIIIQFYQYNTEKKLVSINI